jgi:hypothetical protein
MRSFTIAVASALALPLLTSAEDVWIDPTCFQKPNWQKAWDEANSMEQKMVQRMRKSETDTDYNQVMQTLFKVSQADQSDEWKWIMGRCSHSFRMHMPVV